MKYSDETAKRYIKIKEFIKDNPKISKEEIFKKFFNDENFSTAEAVKSCENLELNNQLLMFLLKNHHLFTTEIDKSTTAHSLFNNINPLEDFGVSNCISNSLYHLTEILKNMELSNLYDGLFEAKGRVTNSKRRGH